MNLNFSIKIIILSILIFSNCINLFSQKTVKISGLICDAISKKGIEDAVVEAISGKTKIQIDANGQFTIEIPANSSEKITVSHSEYRDFSEEINDETPFLHIYLQPKMIALHTMTVTAHSKHTLPKTAISAISVNRNFFHKTNASSLSAALAKLPGINSMNIGAGISKPVIRGMGFNRMAVVDKGIVVQNQQWGADHGLEIDQFDINKIIVHKGAMSLFYGSDAMGGVVEIVPADAPEYDLTWGEAILTAKSNNDLIGASIGVNKKTENWLFGIRATSLYYGDYRIPTDTIQYLTWKMPIQNRRMKNTAGRELNLSGTAKYERNAFNTAFFISNNFNENGSFPGAHGIPDLRRLTFDGSHRNIELPFSTVNHFKITNTTEFPLFTNWHIHSDFGFQANQRFEMARFHTHFPNQPIPEKDSDQELAFNLKTLSGNIRLNNGNENWGKSIGISTEYQVNRIGGYSFLIPEFKRLTVGMFGASDYKIDEKWSVIGGIRLDLGQINTSEFYDPILEEYFRTSGYEMATAEFYAQRAASLHRVFSNVSGSAGFIFKPNSLHQIKANLGRSFRFPTPNELASNGVHHGAFRYEQGNATLKPETGIQLDAEYGMNLKKIRISVSPFVNYFSNYIFLNPTGQWSLLPHTGQRYEYQQTKALISGGELEMNLQTSESLQFSTNFDNVFTLNPITGYSLPFSPPARWTTNAVFSAHAAKLLTHYQVDFEVQKIFSQNRISNNEEKTPGTWLLNLSTSFNWKFGKYRLITEMQVYNLLDKVYLNHLSYYRKLNAPEPGRNIQILLKLPFIN